MMRPYYQDDFATLYHGDCRAVARSLGNVSAIVTDPPYELGFMGRKWDSAGVSFQPETWQTLRDVCKSGATLMAFGGSRTYHRMTVAIEDAGWEVRDCLTHFFDADERLAGFYESLSDEQKGAFMEMFAPAQTTHWIYGSGFPKSLDISKAIDKAAGGEREIVGSYKATGTARRLTGGNYGGGGHNTNERDRIYQTAPATPLAQLWNGYGTALKPAYEPVVLAMNPLDGTFAQNAERHGVAGLNVDAGRIESGPSTGGSVSGGSALGQSSGWNAHNNRAVAIDRTMSAGRFPANIILDEAAAGALDEQSGESRSTDRPRNNNYGVLKYNGTNARPCHSSGKIEVTGGYADSGGASRFFYCAKASRSERGAFNDHPTVKSLALITYLLKLVTMPRDTLILDPFAGSGTTLLAARRLGLPCIGIEQDAHNCEIIKRRLEEDAVKDAPLLAVAMTA
jgi:DNA modification methylase